MRIKSFFTVSIHGATLGSISCPVFTGFIFSGLLLAIICFSIGAQSSQLQVLVDPGHGGTDTGAVKGELRESDIVLDIAKKLVGRLNSRKEFRATLTRTNDRLVSLEERTLTAKKMQADVFVSIHANSSPSEEVRGVEVYFQNQMPPDEESLYLANRENEGLAIPQNTKPKSDLAAILDDLHRQFQIHMSFQLAKNLYRVWTQQENTRIHIRQAPFHVLSEVSTPSILIETGFLTNAQDGQRLGNNEYRNTLAKIIFEGLMEYRKNWRDKKR